MTTLHLVSPLNRFHKLVNPLKSHATQSQQNDVLRERAHIRRHDLAKQEAPIPRLQIEGVLVVTSAVARRHNDVLDVHAQTLQHHLSITQRLQHHSQRGVDSHEQIARHQPLAHVLLKPLLVVLATSTENAHTNPYVLKPLSTKRAASVDSNKSPNTCS